MSLVKTFCGGESFSFGGGYVQAFDCRRIVRIFFFLRNGTRVDFRLQLNHGHDGYPVFVSLLPLDSLILETMIRAGKLGNLHLGIGVCGLPVDAIDVAGAARFGGPWFTVPREDHAFHSDLRAKVWRERQGWNEGNLNLV